MAAEGEARRPVPAAAVVAAAHARPALRGSRFELRSHDEPSIAEGHALELAREGRWGFVHSEETGSAVDGPGIRLVFWTTGCEFRCAYCHNPDTWKLKNGRLVRVEDLLEEIEKYRDFLRLAGGGVTVSGGEPLLQDRFVLNVLCGARALGVHTALDTNGFLGSRLSDEELAGIDLVLLDVKSWDAETHLRVTGQPVEPVLEFARRLARLGRPAWLRFVLVPGLTDAPANVAGLARFAAELPNVERTEVLPFHQLGRFKWRQLGLRYALEDVSAPSASQVAAVEAVFREARAAARP